MVKDGVIVHEVNVYNQLGQIVWHQEKGIDKIDISMFNQRLYVVEIIKDKGRSVQKLIIKH